MQALTAILTAASLAFHAALGCCWHHGHSPGTRCTTAGTGLQRSCGHAHDHLAHGHRHGRSSAAEDRAEEKSPASNGPCRGECNEGACVFLIGAKPVTPERDAAAPLVGIVPSPSHDAVYSPAARGIDLVPHALPPPLRSHLAKRVLLI